MPNRPGIMDEIRCDEKDYLVWKWRPKGSSQRENAIRWGSSLSVRSGSAAVFVYRRRGERVVQEVIEGPFQDTLKTSNLPVIASLVSTAYAGGTPWQAEVYFINFAKVIQSRFGVRYFDVFDSRFPDFGVPVAVRGTITFHIADCREFIELHRLDEFTLEDFRLQIRDAVVRRVKAIVATLPSRQHIPLLQLSGQTDTVSKEAFTALDELLFDTYGVKLVGLDVSAIEVDKESLGYHQLKAMTQDVTEATIRAQTEANLKSIHDTQRIQMENLSEQLRIEREEGQYAVHKRTQSDNLGAFQIEQQTAVGIAGAEALGHMGENGAAAVGLGGGGGLDIAGLAAGMAVGGVVGQNIAGVMSDVMSGANARKATASMSAESPASNASSNAPTNATVPPSVPVDKYYVAIDGTPSGPFEKTTLRTMATEGTLSADTLVWKDGMVDWAEVQTLSDLASVLKVSGIPTPPPVPSEE